MVFHSHSLPRFENFLFKWFPPFPCKKIHFSCKRALIHKTASLCLRLRFKSIMSEGKEEKNLEAENENRRVSRGKHTSNKILYENSERVSTSHLSFFWSPPRVSLRSQVIKQIYFLMQHNFIRTLTFSVPFLLLLFRIVESRWAMKNCFNLNEVQSNTKKTFLPWLCKTTKAWETFHMNTARCLWNSRALWHMQVSA